MCGLCTKRPPRAAWKRTCTTFFVINFGPQFYPATLTTVYAALDSLDPDGEEILSCADSYMQGCRIVRYQEVDRAQELDPDSDVQGS